jgi:BarA-like signal transduction histidine kinase
MKILSELTAANALEILLESPEYILEAEHDLVSLFQEVSDFMTLERKMKFRRPLAMRHKGLSEYSLNAFLV